MLGRQICNRYSQKNFAASQADCIFIRLVRYGHGKSGILALWETKQNLRL